MKRNDHDIKEKLLYPDIGATSTNSHKKETWARRKEASNIIFGSR